MIIEARIDGKPKRKVRVGWKQSLPCEGDVVRIRSHPMVKNEKWLTVRVNTIVNIGYPLYFMDIV